MRLVAASASRAVAGRYGGPYSRCPQCSGDARVSGEQRRLAAIVSADVAGYSRLMGRDESGTLAALKSLRRDIVDPKSRRIMAAS